MHVRVKKLIHSDYHNSVVRKTLVQAVIIIPGFVANYFIYFFAERLLSSDEFGIFYVALTLGNVLFSAGLILNIFFTRYLVQVIQSNGNDAVIEAIGRIEKFVILLGLVLSILLFSGMSFFSTYLKIQSRLIVLLIVLDAVTSFIADLGRVFFQSTSRSTMLGMYSTLWMFLKLLLCTALIWVTDTVWGGLLGQIFSATIVFVCFHIWTKQSVPRKSVKIIPIPSMVDLIVPTLGYVMLVVISNMDVIVAYLLLSPRDLSVYSASSVFPKAILVVITPLLLMLFPKMVSKDPISHNLRFVIGKILGVTSAMTIGAIFFIWLLSKWICGGEWGMQLCQEYPMYTLLLSALPIALLRVIVMIQLARGRDYLTLWLIIPILLYVPYALFTEHTIIGIAGGYVKSSALTLLIYLGIYLFIEVFSKAQMGKKRLS